MCRTVFQTACQLAAINNIKHCLIGVIPGPNQFSCAFFYLYQNQLFSLIPTCSSHPFRFD